MVGTKLGLADRLGGWKARWGFGRMSYLVPPGLYAIGRPGREDPVLVTANYKMSFDIVRAALAGWNCWLLVLETHGINVWCAAGKGTFGTEELVRRIAAVGLGKVVDHRRLLLPILGGPGVAAPEVKQRTGFSVHYATIRAADLPAYLRDGKQTTPAMRRLSFTFYERLILTPMEVVAGLRIVLPLLIFLFLAGLWTAGEVSLRSGMIPVLAFLGAFAGGTLIAPLLLPWLPSRSFALKGAVIGALWAVAWYLIAGGDSWRMVLAAFLFLPAVSAFFALNFTGCTPYTSRSGVKKEMRLSLPWMAVGTAAGLVLWLVDRFQG